MPLASCANQSQSQKLLPSLNQPQLERAVNHWRQKYSNNPNDKFTGLHFADILRRTNANEQSLAVMQQLAIKYPNDRQVLEAYAKALVAAGHLHKALATIERAQTPDNPNWKLLSAQAIVLDRLGESITARKLYKQALELNPNQPSLLSNLAMSYLLTGELVEAEKHLQLAIKQNGSDTIVRQNLILVLSLQGKYKQAIELGINELSQLKAQENIHYIRKITGKKI